LPPAAGVVLRVHQDHLPLLEVLHHHHIGLPLLVLVGLVDHRDVIGEAGIGKTFLMRKFLSSLGNGVTVYLPSWKALRPDGTCFEGEGIAPDFPIRAAAEELKTADPILQAALTLLRRR